MDYRPLEKGARYGDDQVSVVAFGEGQDQDHSPINLHMPTPSFLPARMWPVSVLMSLLLIANEVQMFLDWSVGGVKNDPKFKYVVPQCGLLGLLSLVAMLYRWDHQRLRMNGYLEFYLQANRPIRFSFIIVALADCLVCLLYIFYPLAPAYIPRASMFQAVVSLTNASLLVLNIWYVTFCLRHNRTRPVPDAAMHDALPASLSTSMHGPPSGPSGLSPADLMRRQAMLIQHQESQIRHLGEEVLRQKTYMRKAQGLHATRPAGDLDQLLAAKDQDLRSLKSERDRLRRDLTKASEDHEAYLKMTERVQKENKEVLELSAGQKKKIRALTKENSKLQVLIEVHKEGNANAQKVIDSLTNTTSLI